MEGDTLMMIDILFALGTIGFLSADIKQIWKMHKHKFPTNAISRTHLKIKIGSLICVSTAYAMSQLPISFVVSISQLILTVGILVYTISYYTEN
jgi:hypothetical protein